MNQKKNLLKLIHEKFGGDFIADDNTFVMGIDRRFTTHLAERFSGKIVLETCTGGGFSTISLAETAHHVISVDIDREILEQAKMNMRKTGMSERVTFICGDILDENLLENTLQIDAAFLDPDWAVNGPNHQYRFLKSNTEPPADILLERIFESTSNISLILPPFIDPGEFNHLPVHECEKLFMGNNHELYCLWFGDLIHSVGLTDFKVSG